MLGLDFLGLKKEKSLFPIKRKKEDSIISISINLHFIGHLISFLSTL